MNINKILFPSFLIAILSIAGIFVLVPVENATTVHSTLPTATNVEEKLDAQNRIVNFYLNMTHTVGPITIIPAESGVTLTGSAILSAIPNQDATDQKLVGGSPSSQRDMNCGLQSTTPLKLGINATGGMTNSTTFSTANGLVADVGIQVVLSNASSWTGVCTGTIFLDSWGG